MSRYAVVDIETTGFSPAHNHRIVEVAIVLVDDGGTSVYEWETLVNPERDVGPTEVHGLTGADVYSAPTFAEIAPELESLLRGRVPVAHNLSFDAPFLAFEFGRAGFAVPLDRTSGLCTMRLASHYLSTSSRTLEACCECIGCRIESAHAALEDARATARLLAHYVAEDEDFLGYWVDSITAAQSLDWPVIEPAACRHATRSSTAASANQHFLARLASRTPRSEIHPEANSYLALLDRALLDRQISRHEADELVAAAEMMGISLEDALALHRLYLSALGSIAVGDGVVTAPERQELETVAHALGLSSDAVEASLDSAGTAPDGVCAPTGLAIGAGDAVVFTGEAPGIDRADLEYQARTLGLRVTGAVSGKTCLVIAADPDSISGKARKARELGIPIVDYPTYLGMLDSLAC